jgi:hypothetical protein
MRDTSVRIVLMTRRTYLSEVPPPNFPIKPYSRMRVTLKPNKVFGANLSLWRFKAELERLGFQKVEPRTEQSEVIAEVTAAAAFSDLDNIAEYISEAVKVLGYSHDDFSCGVTLIRQGDSPG